ncbi:septum site-determining protein MinC [Candidatus Amarolinea aalborgensis]|jgi:septum site-determining protein MinC|uniref:septum site-determining protein MinC n=1 Tax=Candidatus Amarolinea aalborgensis TaxID=2249329 RepID=UPI003BF95356
MVSTETANVRAEQAVQIRGTSSGLVITLPDGDFDAVLAQVDERLQAMASFVKGGRVAVAAGSRLLTEADITAIGHMLETHQVSLWALVSDQPTTQRAAASLGLAIQVTPALRANGSRALGSARAAAPATNAGRPGQTPALLVHAALRSGQTIEHPGAVIVIGDVQPGAQLIAGGDVVVWGRLAGIVHAGMLGDQPAVVCALALQPTELRIGSAMWRAPAARGLRWLLPGRRNRSTPQVARIMDGAIVIEPWDQVKYESGAPADSLRRSS